MVQGNTGIFRASLLFVLWKCMGRSRLIMTLRIGLQRVSVKDVRLGASCCFPTWDSVDGGLELAASGQCQHVPPRVTGLEGQMARWEQVVCMCVCPGRVRVGGRTGGAGSFRIGTLDAMSSLSSFLPCTGS